MRINVLLKSGEEIWIDVEWKDYGEIEIGKSSSEVYEIWTEGY